MPIRTHPPGLSLVVGLLHLSTGMFSSIKTLGVNAGGDAAASASCGQWLGLGFYVTHPLLILLLVIENTCHVGLF